MAAKKKAPAKKAPPKKGVPGKNTGAAARAAIRAAQRKGMTLEQIGNIANRSESVISAIKSGEIKNPPRNVASNIRKRSTKQKNK
jgi:hypothetical protein